MRGEWRRFDIRHFLCIFRAEYSTILNKQENQLYVFVKAQGCNTPQNAANIFLRVKIYMWEERGDEREKKWGIEEKEEKEANLDLRRCPVPQCDRPPHH